VVTPQFSVQSVIPSLHNDGEVWHHFDYIANIDGKKSVEASRAEIAHLLISTVPPNSYGIVSVANPVHHVPHPSDHFAQLEHSHRHRFGHGEHRPMNAKVQHPHPLHVEEHAGKFVLKCTNL
jgi:hypothetical protein